MSLEDTLRFGPVNLPVRYLVFVAAFAVGFLVMTLILLKRDELRRPAGNSLFNALALFVVVWKLEPIGAALVAGVGKTSIEAVLLQAFVPGGRNAAIIGGAAAATYLIVRVFRAGGPPLKHAGAVAAAILPAVLFYVGAELVLKPRPAEFPGGVASASTGSAPPIGTAVGDRAPFFVAPSLDGRVYRLADARGTIIVLNFWATWCPPCRAELPDLVRFASSHSSHGVAVWAVNMTNSEVSTGTVREFSRKHGIDFPVLLDSSGSIAHDYGVNAVPTTFIISKEGVIVAKQVGAMSPSWLRGRATPQSR